MQRSRHYAPLRTAHLDDFLQETGGTSLYTLRATMAASRAKDRAESLPLFMRELDQIANEPYKSANRAKGLELFKDVIKARTPEELAKEFQALLTDPTRSPSNAQTSFYVEALQCLLTESPETLKKLKNATDANGSVLVNFLKKAGKKQGAEILTRDLIKNGILTQNENAVVHNHWQKRGGSFTP